MTKSSIHATHAARITRLKRADGPLRAMIGMIEDGKPKLGIAQQRQAVANANRARTHDHMTPCLNQGPSPADRDGLKAIARSL